MVGVTTNSLFIIGLIFGLLVLFINTSQADDVRLNVLNEDETINEPLRRVEATENSEETSELQISNRHRIQPVPRKRIYIKHRPLIITERKNPLYHNNNNINSNNNNHNVLVSRRRPLPHVIYRTGKLPVPVPVAKKVVENEENSDESGENPSTIPINTVPIRTNTVPDKTTPTRPNTSAAKTNTSPAKTNQPVRTNTVPIRTNTVPPKTKSAPARTRQTTSKYQATTPRRKPSLSGRNRLATNDEVGKETTKQRLDRFLAFFPVVQERTVRLGQMVFKNEQTSRSGRLRLWKDIYKIRHEVLVLQDKCDNVFRNISDVTQKIAKQSVDLNSFKQSQKRKIEQIETHQGSQDLQYFDFFERSVNNTREITDIHRILNRLMPIMTEFARQQSRQEQLERKALSAIEMKSQEEIDAIKKKLTIQGKEIADLTERVVDEVEILHSHKQSMANSLTAHQKWITESLNEQLAAQVKRMNSLELSLNRHGEIFKGITGSMSDRDERITTEKQKRVLLEHAAEEANRGVTVIKRNITNIETNVNEVKEKFHNANQTIAQIEEKSEELTGDVNRNTAKLSQNEERLERAEQRIVALTDEMNEYRASFDDAQVKLMNELKESVKENTLKINRMSDKVTRDVKEPNIPVPAYVNEEASPLITPREIMSMIKEIGFEEKMDRLSRIMRMHQLRLNNMTREVQRVNEDTQSVALTTEHYFALINTQERFIRNQNRTIQNLTKTIIDQNVILQTLNSDIQYQRETINKLTNIVTNLSKQLRVPHQLQRDCHDLWQSGHTSSGVYTIFEGIGTRLVYCNMTEEGGWTVIQRRVNGREDFDRNMHEYRVGFGNIYMDYWMGLDAIRTMAQFRVNTLRVILEDWEGNKKYATYSYFSLAGPGYALSVRGYYGDAGDSLSPDNDREFVVRRKDESNRWAHSECATTRHAGWWFAPRSSDCGPSNLNGVYMKPEKGQFGPHAMHWRSWQSSILRSVSMQIIPTSTQPLVEQQPDIPLPPIALGKQAGYNEEPAPDSSEYSFNSDTNYLNEDYDYFGITPER